MLHTPPNIEMTVTKNKKVANKAAASQVYPSIYLGPRSAASDSAFLSSHSIAHVLSIGATPSARVPGVTYHRLGLLDTGASSISKVASDATCIIDAAVSENNCILVHCSAAISRSPTIVAAYLIARHKLPLKQALGRLVLERPTVCPNAGFLRQLQDLEMDVFGRPSLNIGELPKKQLDRELLFRE